MAEENKGFFRGLMNRITGTNGEASTEQSEPLTPPPVEPASGEPEKEDGKPSLFERLKRGLSKTHESFIGRIDTLVLGKKQIDADTLEELEEVLITADIGV